MSTSFARRDQLLDIQRRAQSLWESLKVFEVDAPVADAAAVPKFICSFPYPYMNGFLHVGHAFTFSKTEFATGYERLKGKNALFPFGFHCTGMPIQACANKLKAELEQYGNPPNFPVEEESSENTAMKSKVAAKTGKAKRQWDILVQSGISESEIHKFASALEWLRFFPTEGLKDVTAFGAKVDWRRSFITTSVNPFYDSFIRWQFNLLKSIEKVKFGHRYTVWSPLDGQACADHDRASGEGVGPQEYTLIKMKVKEPFPEVLSPLAGKEVFLAAATLRPETMYGQTNCWILPDGDYGAYELKNGDVFVMTDRAARNMAFQEFFPEFGKYSALLTVKGKDLIGLPLKAPNAIHDPIYVLPLTTVSTTKGTGVVTSVPSDAPDDYRGLQDLKEKEKLRNDFDLKEEWIMPFDPVPIIEIADLGNLAAVKACEIYKVKSQKDKEGLAKAKEEVYKKGFYGGTMIIGEFSGQSVEYAKNRIKTQMVESGDAVIYNETEKMVISRTGDECVVALTDQWYLDYGEAEWRALAEECLESMETYALETRHGFEGTLKWLHEWACTRTFGLGTKLPWDPQWVIESLSDSTIYMAYYTVAHLLQGAGNLEGSKPGPLNIQPSELTDPVWSYILLGKELTDQQLSESGIARDSLEKLRNEFAYWYPLDLRVSGKDLVPNHLTFWIYNHVAIFPRAMWPKAVRANGHILINGEKMSKQTGNFITLRDAIDQYSADAVRLALADAGDTVEDANFSTKTVSDTAILKLTTLLALANEGLAVVESMRTGPLELFADRAFAAQLNDAVVRADAAYGQMMYRDALKICFFELQYALGSYRVAVGADKTQASLSKMHKDLFTRFLEAQAIMLSPICPHTCEHIYSMMHPGETVLNAKWPVSEPVDDGLLEGAKYLDDVMHRLRVSKQNQKGAKKETEKPNAARMYICEDPPEWQKISMSVLRENFDAESRTFPNDLAKRVTAAMPAELKKKMKKIMPFVGMVRDAAKEQGEPALDRTLRYDEKEVLTENMELIREQLGLVQLDICSSTDTGAEDATLAGDALPGRPTFAFHVKESS
mmetsp:Transcript_3351/g.15833  ORF Transcript_3351/g.15833 Transcript_3351/m.15833 type:complete len:1059 (-) Transcript_3351:3429-6605(-)